MFSPEELTLSVVDQSPLRKGGTGADALTESVRLAQRCERLGYARYWVAEHHASTSWTGASPEILIGQIAAGTSTIRVGSGGVMLSHYSALKVAEQFRALDAFHPGRIDLGVGRAPGSDQRTAFALAHPRQPADVRTFPRQVHDLLAFLSGEMAADHPFAGISPLAGPQPGTGPEVWLLGSSDFSARLAAMLGLPFAFADFFGNLDHGPLVADLYRREFQPSAYLDAPRLNVTVQVMCAPTEEEARYLASSRNLNKLRQLHLERPSERCPRAATYAAGCCRPRRPPSIRSARPNVQRFRSFPSTTSTGTPVRSATVSSTRRPATGPPTSASSPTASPSRTAPAPTNWSPPRSASAETIRSSRNVPRRDDLSLFPQVYFRFSTERLGEPAEERQRQVTVTPGFHSGDRGLRRSGLLRQLSLSEVPLLSKRDDLPGQCELHIDGVVFFLDFWISELLLQECPVGRRLHWLHDTVRRWPALFPIARPTSCSSWPTSFARTS